jgi:prepilin-type N-terminal cleavage/methylation domain-containing protein
MTKSVHRTEGFTLVETLVALAIIAMVVLGIAPLFLNATKSNASAFDYTMASSLVREKIDELKQLPKIPVAPTSPDLLPTAIAPDPNPSAHSDAVGTILNGVYVIDPLSPNPSAYTRTWTCINYNIAIAGPHAGGPAYDPADPVGPGRQAGPIVNPVVPYDVKEIRVTVQPLIKANGTVANLPGVRRSSARYLYANPDPTTGDQ